MLGHHNQSPVFDCKKVQTEASVLGAQVVVLDYMEINDDHKECALRMTFLSAFEYL